MGDATTAPPRILDVLHSINHGNLPDCNIGEEPHSLMNHLDPLLREDRVNFAEVSKSENNARRKRLSTNDQALHRLDYTQKIESSNTAYASRLEKGYPNEKDLQACCRHMDQEESRSMVSHEISYPVIQMATNDSADIVKLQSSHSHQNSCSEVIGKNFISDETRPHEMSKIEEFMPNSPSSAGTESDACQQSDIITSKTPSSKRRASLNFNVNNIIPKSVSEDALKSVSTPNYPVNTRNPASNSISTPCPTKPTLFTTPPVPISKMPLSCPERILSSNTKSSPRVRLSLSLDGKAELTADYPSPSMQISRPKSASGNLFCQRKIESRRRCQSLILPCSSGTVSGQLSASPVPRRPIGRSRDARSWAFCCDGECRDELTRQAENESHGSAVAAISLIRSAFNPVLKTSPKKRSATVSEPKPGCAKKLRIKKRLFSQTEFQDASMSSNSLDTPEDDCINYMITSPSGDSDKENWMPQQNGSPRRRPLPSSRLEKLPHARTILGDNEVKNTNSASFESFKSCKRRLTNSLADIYRDRTQFKAFAETEKIGNGEASPSKIGDLGAIQGLLSLSKGNWR